MLKSCVNCEKVKLPSFSSSWPEAISCQHNTIISWKENGTKCFNCVFGTEFDGSAQGTSPCEVDSNGGLVDGRIEGRTGVHVERYVVLKCERKQQ